MGGLRLDPDLLCEPSPEMFRDPREAPTAPAHRGPSSAHVCGLSLNALCRFARVISPVRSNSREAEGRREPESNMVRPTRLPSRARTGRGPRAPELQRAVGPLWGNSATTPPRRITLSVPLKSPEGSWPSEVTSRGAIYGPLVGRGRATECPYAPWVGVGSGLHRTPVLTCGGKSRPGGPG